MYEPKTSAGKDIAVLMDVIEAHGALSKLTGTLLPVKLVLMDKDSVVRFIDEEHTINTVLYEWLLLIKDLYLDKASGLGSAMGCDD